MSLRFPKSSTRFAWCIAWCFAVGCWLRVATPVEACPVCLPFPKQSLADHLIEADEILFARESSEQPFTYYPVEWLKGHGTSASRAALEDLFLNSSVRRQLNSDGDRLAVLVFSGQSNLWRQVSVADPRLQQLIRRIVLLAPEWLGSETGLERCHFFAPFFGDHDRRIFELAYLELGRAPYPLIKRMAAVVSQEQLQAVLHRLEYLEWRSLAILLIAQDPSMAGQVESGFRGCEELGYASHLSAWATALIELHGIRAIDRIENSYLRNPKRSQEEIRSVMIALSVHGNGGHVRLRPEIAGCYGVLLDRHPQFAGVVALDLTAWRDPRYRKRLQKLMIRDKTLDPTALEAIRVYVRDSLNNEK